MPKEKYIIPEEIKAQPIDWLVTFPGYKMKDAEQILAWLREHDVKVIRDLIPRQYELPEPWRIEVVRKIKWNM